MSLEAQGFYFQNSFSNPHLERYFGSDRLISSTYEWTGHWSRMESDLQMKVRQSSVSWNFCSICTASALSKRCFVLGCFQAATWSRIREAAKRLSYSNCQRKGIRRITIQTSIKKSPEWLLYDTKSSLCKRSIWLSLLVFIITYPVGSGNKNFVY